MKDLNKKHKSQTSTTSIKSYSWISSNTHEDQFKAYYNSIKVINHDNNTHTIYAKGDTILFHSQTCVPYIAYIESLYEEKSSSKKYIITKWFYRVKDIKESTSKQYILNNNISTKYDIFLCDSILDHNHIESILRPCTVLFSPISTSSTSDNSEDIVNNILLQNKEIKDIFICKYRYLPDTYQITPFTSDEVERLNNRHMYSNSSNSSSRHSSPGSVLNSNNKGKLYQY